MKTNQKVRLCPYCEGSVDIESTHCRFCGASFEEPVLKIRGGFEETPHSSQYKPPYIPPTELLQESVFFPENKETIKKGFAQEEDKEEEEKGHIIALTLLSSGGMLLTLSLLLFFFGEHGRVVLEWKSRYWSLYMILGAPMLYYGSKKLKEL